MRIRLILNIVNPVMLEAASPVAKITANPVKLEVANPVNLVTCVMDSSVPSTSMALSGSPFLLFDVHYGGRFNFMPLRYENGLVYQWCVRKDNELNLATVRDFLRQETKSIIMYELFFKLPQCELNVGLEIIENERDLEAMYDYAHKYGIIHVYITHGPQDLAPFYVKNMCFYGSGDDVKSRRKTVTKDASNMSVEELLTRVNGIMVDEGKVGRKTARSRNSGIIIGENVNPTFSEDDDSDSDIDMKQRFKGSAELEEIYNGNTYSKSEYSDKFIYYMSEVAGCSRPNRVYDVGESDIVIEHEVYMDKLMHQLRDDGDVDEKYVDVDQLKECLTSYSLANGFSLRFYKSSKEHVIARCGMRPEKLKDIEKGKQRKHFKYPINGRNEGSNCPFRCYGKLMVTESSFHVISLNEEHTCVRNFKYGNLVNYKWIGKQFGHKIRQNPEIKLHEIADLVMKKYKCIVNPSQCRNAKTFALNHGETTTEEHYVMIRSHGKEILDSNDGSTVKLGVTVNPDDKTYFDRFYCCFYRLKKGFQLGCRHVIALDGCFLKKPNVGEILTAVGSEGVESSAANDTVRCASLGDFVCVRSKGTKTRTTSRGGLGVRRRRAARIGRGGQTLEVRRGTSGSTSTARGKGGQTPGLRVRRGIGFRGGVTQGIQQEPQAAEEESHAQIGIQQEQPAVEEGRQAQANRNIERGNQNLRPRSARIMKNKLARSIDGIGSSNTNAPDLD
ncbi:hypothetical protein Tco_0092907 [Tanacetum coccineum]